MNGLTEQDRALRGRARATAAAVLTIFLTGMIALGTPEDEHEPAVVLSPVPAASESTRELAQAPVPHPHPLDQTPWQWDPSDY